MPGYETMLAIRGCSQNNDNCVKKLRRLKRYDPDSSEIGSDNEAPEKDMKVTYTYLLPKESDVSVECN